jgi:hypothetical protein
MFNLFPKKKSIDKIIEDANLTPAWQFTPTQTPSMLQPQNDLIDDLIEQILKENHDHKCENQKLKRDVHQPELCNEKISELTKEILQLRHLKEENVKLIECIKNLREQQDFLYKENVELIERVNEIDNDVIRDLKDEILVWKNDYAVLRAKHQIVQNDYKKCAEQRDEYKHQLNAANKDIKAQKHPMYPLHWMGLDPLIHEQAKNLIIEETIDKVKQKTPWVEEPVDWKGEKSWEEVASDLALRVVKLEKKVEELTPIKKHTTTRL